MDWYCRHEHIGAREFQIGIGTDSYSEGIVNIFCVRKSALRRTIREVLGVK